MDSTLSTIGRQIASKRRERRMTQQQLATAAGVSRATVDLVENGRASEIGYSKLLRMLGAVGLEVRVEPISTRRPTLEDLLSEEAGD